MEKIYEQKIDQIQKKTSYYNCTINVPYAPDWCPDTENIEADALSPNRLQNTYFENCTFEGDTSFVCSNYNAKFLNCHFSGKLLLFLWHDQRFRVKGCEASVTDLVILRRKKSKQLNPTLSELYEASRFNSSVLGDLKLELYTSLTRIKFLKLKLSQFPSIIFLFPNLCEIDLSHCGIYAEFLDLQCEDEPYLSLKKLNISHNNFESLYGISQLPSLVELDCSSNEIEEIPEDIENLTSLQTLDLHENNLNLNLHEKTVLKELLPQCSIKF